MKQTIVDLLKTKFDGVDESILGRIADTKAAKAIKTQEEAEAYVDGLTLTQLLTSFADIRSTEAQRTAISHYEKKHGIKDGKKVTEDDPNALDKNTDNNDDVPAWAQRLLDDNKKLNEQVAAMTADKLYTSRKEKFEAVINRLPENNRRGYARTAYKDMSEEEFDTLLTEVGAEVDATLKEVKTHGATFGAPAFRTQRNADHKGEASKEEVDAVLAKF